MIAGPIAVSGLGAEAEASAEVDPSSGLPTKKEVKQGFDYYLALAPHRSLPEMQNGRILPDEAVRWSLSALNNYETASGGVKQSQDFKVMVASARDYQGLDMNDYNVRAYANALGEISGAASLEHYSIAVEAGVLTAESFRDGKMSEQEAQDLGAVTGALVGGVVAQSVGVPAPIGAFVGATIGGGSAAMIHNVLAAPSFEKRMKQLERKISRKLSSFRHEAIIECAAFEMQYWNEFDDFISRLASSWTVAEERIGWRFQLRWFDPNPGLAFQYYWNPTTRMYPKNFVGGDPKRGTRSDTLISRIARSGRYVTYATEQGGRVGETVYSYDCPHIYGCPYPNLRLSRGKGVPRNVVQAALDNGMRVTEAFAARGAIWIPKQDRIDCNEYIYPWPKNAEIPAEDAIRFTYKNTLNNRLRALTDQYYRYVQARSFIRADLARTIACVDVERDVYLNKSIYITEGAANDALARAKKSSQQLSTALGAATLAGGMGLLGYAFWKALR